jgi:hypothetical protein
MLSGSVGQQYGRQRSKDSFGGRHLNNPRKTAAINTSVTPRELAVDSAAVFLALVSWTFCFWVPITLPVAVVLLAKSPPKGLFFILAPVAIPLFLVGIALKFLSAGVVQRGWKRIAASAVLLFIMSGFALLPILIKIAQGQRIFECILDCIVFSFVAVVVCFGLKKQDI